MLDPDDACPRAFDVPAYVARTRPRLAIPVVISQLELRPVAHAPEVPETLSAVVVRMTQKAPDKRYPTPAAVLDALAPWLTASPARVRVVMESGSGHDPGLWEELAALGIPGLLVPAELGGAGLDVLVDEPPAKDHPLFGLPTVTLTPHSAGPTWENWTARFRNGFDNIERVAAGRRPLWVIPEL